jgi:Ca-activated chloride channel family protein
MQMKKLLRYLVILGVLISALACASTTSNNPPANAVVIDVTANSSLAPWLNEAVGKFNDTRAKTSNGKPVYVQLQSVEAGQAVVDISGGKSAPALWIPDGPDWMLVLADKGKTEYQGDCVSVASSPLVIAMWRPVAEALGWPGRSLGWLDVGSLAADPSAWAYYSGGQYGPNFRLGHTHPGLSASGADTLLAVVQAALSRKDAVDAGEIQQPIVQASVGAFEGAVASFGKSTDQLGQSMRERGTNFLSAAIVYESTVVEYGGGDPGIVAVYPFEGTFIASHPACVNASLSSDLQEAARLFRDYLIGVDGQQQALAHGLRPVNPQVPIGAPLDVAHGVDPDEPRVVFEQPGIESVYAVQTLWQSARKDVNLVMIIDTSGSMSGEKIKSVRLAAEQFVQQMGDDDYITLITYNDTPVIRLEYVKVGPERARIIQEIRQLSADGNTPLYDSMAIAAEIIARHLSPLTTNAMVVLSDGQDTASTSFDFNQKLVSAVVANDTVIFTIAYGSDANENMLSGLALQANGNFYRGTEASIAAIYEEMSAAFGGSAGIGR